MILDILENGAQYAGLNEGLARAFEFLTRPDLKDLPADRYEIDGDRVYALVVEGRGHKREDATLEAHEKYIDIQLVLEGVDEMGWKPKSACAQPAAPYDGEKDAQLFDDEPDVWVTTRPGVFAIFFPDDAHMPMVSSGFLRKAVAKVAVDQG